MLMTEDEMKIAPDGESMLTAVHFEHDGVIQSFLAL